MARMDHSEPSAPPRTNTPEFVDVVDWKELVGREVQVTLKERELSRKERELEEFCATIERDKRDLSRGRNYQVDKWKNEALKEKNKRRLLEEEVWSVKWGGENTKLVRNRRERKD